jgi:hypothetical protein
MLAGAANPRGVRRVRRVRHVLRAVVLPLAALLLLVGCESPTGVGAAAKECGPLPLFTHLPVAADDIHIVAVVGGLGAPGHTLPTAHAGISVNRVGTPVYSPGRIQVTEVRRVRYVASPGRQGATDYAVNYQVCRDVEGWFGHITSLSASFDPSVLNWGNCSSYDTSDETIENCFARPRDLWLEPGEGMGTAGMSVELGFMGYDVGLLDRRVNHVYASPWRHPVATFHAVCPWEYYDAASQATLFGKLRDPSRTGVPPEGEPRCGTMEVDVVGTVKGVWASPEVTTPLAGDERAYLTLANNPYRPQLELALSLGPEALGARVALVARATSGRVNRAFDEVAGDDLIYCYGPPVAHLAGASWLLSLSPTETLRMERVPHAHGASPCADPPESWSFSTAARTFVR